MLYHEDILGRIKTDHVSFILLNNAASCEEYTMMKELDICCSN
jgi:hypothetical protein